MHPSFIRGFVKQCFDQGLSEDQCEAALKAWGLREALEDPDFRQGFDKQALTLQNILAKGKSLASNAATGFQGLGRPAQGAILGGAAGLAGGAILGGKHRFRNSLLAALTGAGLGGLAGNYLGQPAPLSRTAELAKMQASAPVTSALLDKKIGKPGEPLPQATAITGFKTPEGQTQSIAPISQLPFEQTPVEGRGFDTAMKEAFPPK
jgi:hypothetical protein